MNYEIETGTNLKFTPISNLPDGLIKFLKVSLNELQSIEAFTIVSRKVGILGLRKIMTLLLFYNDQNQYQKDNITLTREFEDYFKTQNYFIDLLAFDMSIKFSLNLIQKFENLAIEIIKTTHNTSFK
ncbi:MAG: hypothetical protein HOD63_01460 [Bacteroidetes bacterium]|jgi:hypothetical protein|nr:hypothetical protein [Bacteroidota bacterium]MBT5529130.1 hypothetical protein [Cytophagia bacterium]MBT3422491.1 hypothetical protein [Bacteroidota bacterium]MBT3800908.1 hypothetical protein [Bacteroidota bacterium]MBT3935339.1 hypothetical protein [Bacteroidota bacterium]